MRPGLLAEVNAVIHQAWSPGRLELGGTEAPATPFTK
jgi:hypothetical protein